MVRVALISRAILTFNVILFRAVVTGGAGRGGAGLFQHFVTCSKNETRLGTTVYTDTALLLQRNTVVIPMFHIFSNKVNMLY
jgi:hypothetical protein